MPYNMRDPSTGQSSSSSNSISTAFAFTVLAALIGLIVLRHLFGSIRLEVGAR